LRRAADTGATVVVVTGRPPRWLAPVAVDTGHVGLAVCANGAYVYDLSADEIVEEHLLTADVARSCVRRLRLALPDLSFAVERGAGFGYEPGYRPRWAVPDEAVVADVDALLGDPVGKLLARHEALTADELLALASEVVGDVVTLTHSSREGLLEISAAGVSKATTLATLCAERGLDSGDVVAFGDMPNDLPMLAWAGWSVAVATAHPDVLAAVDEVTRSNDEDGVAVVLERLYK
jgi:hydroxymethylpyrimidine pyrophosphatase-like HAD family hydrolase